MKFKSDRSTGSGSALATREPGGKATTTKGSSSKGGNSFKVNTSSFTSTLADIVPGEMQGWFGEIGEALGGIDLNQPLSWTKEQVIAANKQAAELDKKILEMAEVKNAVMKYLAYAMKEAEFKADLCVAMAKAKGYIDQQQAKAYLAYVKYLRSAARLEKKVKATQQIIDASNSSLEQAFDARKAAILNAVNQSAKLSGSTAAEVGNLRVQRQQLLQQHKQEMAQYKHELATGHLAGSAA
ncbi:hypothetical protein G7B40_031275 [Aetokthonos hydrillicola Thurmond2011]|jgi:hypothetical protein|uniref:Uncharacterized protein n=2 Tax=Aetokthonos TaxID=1550243 RepID=A0AAP5IF65_9CYAN|nr:hypothetical protein [Aetokthonos hydrillicola]MBO3463256.1 hypothetical protein [Aetokthonos hydrillicola CCALA 1050]MBW4590519.1 hypothetical protein [Aetokthonos hydrillicola CCALA 1050]MDR9899007.1 hypothetical protein [Aetokthonos hydrillicola Thurmond2011]